MMAERGISRGWDGQDSRLAGEPSVRFAIPLWQTYRAVLSSTRAGIGHP
jgi:hypothetical protein